jgi:hypothetical protein
MANPKLSAASGWTLRSVAATGKGRRAARGADPLLAQLDPRAVAVVGEYDAIPATRRRWTTPVTATAHATAALVLTLEAAPGERLCLMVRRPSGAIAFEFGTDAAAKRSRARARTQVFSIAPVGSAPIAANGRRGPIGRALRIVVLKLLAPVARMALPRLARRWEESHWRSAGLQSGWTRIVGNSGADLELQAGPPTTVDAAAGPILLLVHGTFSDTRGSFGQLAAGGFFEQARTRYGDRIFGFEHFTLSESLDDNLNALWEALPNTSLRLDLVGYSRGCLLVRGLLDRALSESGSKRRVRVEHLALVAGPNLGTPLADPRRFDHTIGWFANLLDALPDNPFTTAAAWISHALSWLAQGITGTLPGLAAMAPDGTAIKQLRAVAARDAARSAAVVAHYTADANFALRLVDMGIDRFFAGDNDLVVPTDGGWLFDGDTSTGRVADNRVLLFGRDAASAVHHTNMLGQAQTSEFLLSILGAGGTRRGAATGPSESGTRRGVNTPAQHDEARAAGFIDVPLVDSDETFHILVLGEAERESSKPRMVVASYRGARVVEPYDWGRQKDPGKPDVGGRTVAAGKRWSRIIALTNILQRYFLGEPGVSPLTPDQLDELGHTLFASLFTGAVGRLYDEARGGQGSRRLNLVLNSNVPLWAEKPWEFALDPQRGSYLATQDIHLLRDVIGAIPTDRLPAHRGPLRMLVAYAQPIDAGALSIDEERRVIARGFRPLAEAGLVVIEALPRATPAALHARLTRPGYPFDVVHFIGHGVYDPAQHASFLVFDDGQGHSQQVHENDVGDILCGRGVRLVFLNACETGRGGGRAQFLRGMAPTLLRRGVPAVIANQFAVDDGAAVTFASALYARLAQGMTVAEAVRESRIAVNYGLAGVGIDWAVPVLFTRAPALRLIVPRADAGSAATWDDALDASAAGRRTASSASAPRYRVGLWDASRALPALRELGERMNTAQDLVHFEVVDVAAPLDARRMRKMPGGESLAYLDADVARERMRGVPLQLGLDLLIGISARPMFGDNTWNIFNRWGPDASGDDSPLALTSTFDFDLAPSAPATDQFLINTTVALLAGHFAELASHSRSKQCPLYYNNERKLELLTDRNRFDPGVRRQLQRKAPELLPALDTLLALVPATRKRVVARPLKTKAKSQK